MSFQNPVFIPDRDKEAGKPPLTNALTPGDRVLAARMGCSVIAGSTCVIATGWI